MKIPPLFEFFDQSLAISDMGQDTKLELIVIGNNQLVPCIVNIMS
jgi:hypothetical protein